MENKIVEEIRSFNRFYTGLLGLLDNYLQQSAYTLPEARILFELYHNDDLTASNLIEILHIDKGYLSRLLRKFEKKKLIVRKRTNADNRVVVIALTPHGKTEFMALNRASHSQVTNSIKHLTTKDQKMLIESMNKIKRLLETKTSDI